MKLLICAQAVDRNDLQVGFFHQWIEELSSHFESVTVLCLREGVWALPKNIGVYPLGEGTLLRVARLLRYSIMLRVRYDAVFVHQGEEFVLAGGWLWFLLRKPVYLWRNHYHGSLLTRLAAIFCTKLFHTSRYSYTAPLAKSMRMPVGVDTGLFRDVGGRRENSILFYARFAPSKRPHVFIEALELLREQGDVFRASLVGTPLPQDRPYAKEVWRKAKELSLLNSVEFGEGRPYGEGPAVFSAHEIFVNLSSSGMYDKMIFEAAACGCLVLAHSADWREAAGEDLTFDGSARDLSEKLHSLLARSSDEKMKLQNKIRHIAQEHSLSKVALMLARELHGR
jgi:glycosyltransferase involved in cell wall biosynthesis